MNDIAPGPEMVWAESGGGPLVVVPASSLHHWGGCTPNGSTLGGGPPDDYDRACAIEDYAGVVTAEAVLDDPAAPWEDSGVRVTDGPALRSTPRPASPPGSGWCTFVGRRERARVWWSGVAVVGLAR
ncbi:Imm21 family immunity protein [Kitasatospora sp. NPDC049285]|uniref:Imm21 family immunity protein n=1 Tax=Kitasatospora sp. NPDC049285 TaxID=3157096 RepID=UPI0034186372